MPQHPAGWLIIIIFIILIYSYYFTLGLWVFCLCECLHIHTQRPEEGVHLQLQTVVSCLLGAGNQTQALQKSSHCSHPLSHLSSPGFSFLFWGLHPLWGGSSLFSQLYVSGLGLPFTFFFFFWCCLFCVLKLA